MKKKGLALIAASALLVVGIVAGSLAWLTDSTEEVKNTFTTADIDIELTETWNTDTDDDNTNDAWKAQMIPGYSYEKDPKVTVKANSEACYLFVKFEENNDASTYLAYTSILTDTNGWTQGTGTGEGKNGIPTNVWYRTVTSSTSDQSWHLLAGDTTYANGVITVKGDAVTKENMETAAKAELVYTAYAAQLYKNNTETFTPAEAWAKVAP